MAKGYWIALVNVKNKGEYHKYVDLAGSAINLHGGNFWFVEVKQKILKEKVMKELLYLFLIPQIKQKNVIIQRNIKKRQFF